MVINKMLRKGKHFDIGGVQSTIEELAEMDGIFLLRDIKERLPIPNRQLWRLIDGNSSFSHCFHRLYGDPSNNGQGLMHVNLKRLNAILAEQARQPIK